MGRANFPDGVTRHEKKNSQRFLVYHGVGGAWLRCRQLLVSERAGNGPGEFANRTAEAQLTRNRDLNGEIIRSGPRKTSLFQLKKH